MRTYREHIRSFVSRIILHSLIIHPAKAGIISHMRAPVCTPVTASETETSNGSASASSAKKVWAVEEVLAYHVAAHLVDMIAYHPSQHRCRTA
jgi:hypothetical protein